MSPGRLWDLIGNAKRLADSKIHRQMLAQYCAGYLMGYSLNEQELIFDRIRGQAANKAGTGGGVFLPQTAVYTALGLGQEVLVLRGRELFCRVEHLLAWRKTSLSLGQDLFTCAFLAWEDLQARRERKYFAWPAVLPVDHKGIDEVLSRGLAENHQHLYGSSQTFSLSWCSLMNDPKTHQAAGEHFQELFTPFATVSGQEWMLSTRQRVEYACACRAFLFRWMKAEELPKAKRKEQASSLWQDFLHTPIEIYISRELPTLRTLYGVAVPQPKGPAQRLDYALEEKIFWDDPDAAFRILAGERSFLYQCFTRFFQNHMDPQAQMVFYLYLVLKSQFRSEMIQTNGRVGFQNFANYQDRKDALCNRPCYEAELIRMAVHAPLTEGRVHTLETRISPQKTEAEDIHIIRRIDSLRDYAAKLCRTMPPLPEKRENSCKTGKEKDEDLRTYFFVLHFIKRKDSDLVEKTVPFAACRHGKLRKTVRKQAISLARALSSSQKLCRRIRGIDAASNEVVCPPEVFAQAFRFLRGFNPEDFAGSVLLGQISEPRLSATYHVGEDFLDIAGALRAIDETVEFLALGRGDRLGHALGLGVDPVQHYGLKGRRIYQSRQERLDDLVWLAHRARDVGVHIDPHIYGRLKTEAETLLLQIYGNQKPVSLTEYACAMKLRGDDPELYLSGRYEPKMGIIHPYDSFGVLQGASLEQYRQHDPIVRLHYLYHFSPEVKKIGAEPIEIQIDDGYIQLMGDAQDAMQEYIREKGLMIECNPSSNVLIGTFQKYGKHPIFRFNNAIIEQVQEKRHARRQLPVCVNTDDLGVFDTSQEMEYALLFQALDSARLEDGSKQYQEMDILAYLEHLRQMGHEATFPVGGTVE